jgi:trehalose 6-phosphate phosphatase
MTIRLPQALSQKLAVMAAATHVLVCSDYDGTLAPIAPRPEQARLLPAAFSILHALAALPDTRVAIISGRTRQDLGAHSGLGQPVVLIGSHGAEGAGQPTDTTAVRWAELAALEHAVAGLCAQVSGAWVEVKSFGIAVHVRQADPADAAWVLANVRAAQALWPGLQVTEGKAVIEFSVLRSGKDQAVRWLSAVWGTQPQVLYLGDDVTDEAAFAEMGPRDVGIKVGAGPTTAAFRVASERDALRVMTFLWSRRAAASGGLTGQKRPVISKVTAEC